MKLLTGQLDIVSRSGELDVLKAWLLKCRNAFGQKTADYGLPAP